MSASESYNIIPVGVVTGTQQNLQLEIRPEYRPALKGLEAFSHCQILWWIHEFAADHFRELRRLSLPMMPRLAVYLPPGLRSALIRLD